MVKIFLKPTLHKARTQGSTKTYTESTLFPISTLEKLLAQIERNFYLSKIQEIVTLPDDYFKSIYEELVDNFALFVQILPDTYGGELGSLLNDGLRRALLAVQILQETREEKPHPLFTFAVFSIALLADIGQVMQYHIMISDEEGVFIDDWYPALGFMHEFGEFYKLRHDENIPQSLIRNSTPIFARQLLSETAITWLSSNTQIFDMWLAFLNKGEDWLGGFCKVLKIERKQFESRKGEMDLFPIDINLKEATGTDLGEKFLSWLKNALQDGSVTYNGPDSLVHVMPITALDVGVFLQAPELFRLFCNAYQIKNNWTVVCDQFKALGLTKLLGTGKLDQFFLSDPSEAKSGKLGFLARERLTGRRSLKEGVVVKDVSTLFGAKTPGVSPHLREELRWKVDNLLPKLREQKITTPIPPKNGFKSS